MSSEDKSDSLQTSFLLGILMGLADAIPGVSGGTVAFLLGFYKKLIKSLSFFAFFIRNLRQRILLHCLKVKLTPFKINKQSESPKKHLYFLLPLATGILISYYFVTLFLVGSTDSPGALRQSSTAPMLYGFFFGLVFASLPRLWGDIENPNKNNLITAFCFAILTYLLLGLSFFSGESTPYILFISGILSLTAMLLPGLSGAMVLVILGQYSYIASSFHDGSFLNLIPFLIGGVFCLFTILPLLQYSLKNHHSETMAVMTGILAGSLKTLWPLKSNYDIHQGPLVNTTFNNADFSNESLLFISLFIIFGFLIENLIIYLKKSTVLLNN